MTPPFRITQVTKAPMECPKCHSEEFGELSYDGEDPAYTCKGCGSVYWDLKDLKPSQKRSPETTTQYAGASS